MKTKREPVVLVMSILAGLQVLAGGAALGDLIGNEMAGVFILAVAALQVGAQFYVRGQVTPVEDIHEIVDERHAGSLGLPQDAPGSTAPRASVARQAPVGRHILPEG